MPTEIRVKVVDASALAALLFGEQDGVKISTLLKGAKLIAPALLTFEVASVCLKKIHRHPDQKNTLLSAYQLLHRMDIIQSEVDLIETITLAKTKDLTVYDAAYLWLANKFHAELVTLDRKLAEATKTV
ncbi:MAG: type II toxin-antitoxin system VapC family toxin [Nitrospiria bacterium]